MKYKLIRDGVLTASTILFVSGLVKLLPNRNPQLFLIAGTLGLTGSALVKKQDDSEAKEKLEQDITIKIKQELVELNNRTIFTLEQQVKQTNNNFNSIHKQLLDLINREVQNVNQAINNKILVFEKQLEEITKNSDVDKQKLLDLIARKTQRQLQKADEKMFALEQQIREISCLTEQELIEVINRETQDVTLKLNEKIAFLEQQIKDTVKISNSELQALITKQNRQNQSARYKLKAYLEKKIIQAQVNLKQNEDVAPGIIELLKDNGVEVEPTSVKYDPQQNILANHIAINYDFLQDFYQQLIRSIEDNHTFEYCLRHKHNADIQIHTVFGSELKNLGFYPEYRYIGQNTKIMYIPACQDQAKTKFLQFLKGGWFEAYTLNIIIKYLKNNSQLKYSFLLNPYAIFFTENDNRPYRRHELDLLFLIENNLIWIECKSGRVNDGELQKYSDNNQQFLKFPKQNALVVCFKISETEAAIKTQQYPGVTIVNPDSLLQSIKTILNSRRSTSSPVLRPTTQIVDQVKNNAVVKTDSQPVGVGS